MRMCRHWIWIGRRDCESSVRTAIRMNGEQQATQHTPTLTARQGTPLHNQHPTTQATTYAETGRAAGFCGRRKPRHRPRLQQRHIPRKPQPLGRGGAAASNLDAPEGIRRQPPQAATRMTKGARLGKSGAKAPDRDRGREQPRRPARGATHEAPAHNAQRSTSSSSKAVAAVKTTASQTANTPAPKDQKTAPQRRRLLQNPNPQRFCLSCERSRTAPDPPKSPAPHKPARPATPPAPDPPAPRPSPARSSPRDAAPAPHPTPPDASCAAEYRSRSHRHLPPARSCRPRPPPAKHARSPAPTTRPRNARP